MKNKASLDHWLKMFNRKERYHLLVNALANISGNFKISSEYKSKIQTAANLENKNHRTVFVAMGLPSRLDASSIGMLVEQSIRR